MTITLRYPEYGEGCEHTFPDDWEFGGAVGGDPRADKRWRPTNYVYFDRTLRPIHYTCVPLCDHAALTVFKGAVQRYRPDSKIFFIQAQRPDGTEEMIYQDVEGALGGSTS